MFQELEKYPGDDLAISYNMLTFLYIKQKFKHLIWFGLKTPKMNLLEKIWNLKDIYKRMIANNRLIENLLYLNFLI